MKSVWSSLLCPVLMVCLVLFGPLGMATDAGGEGAFAAELCVDGVLKTVVIGADGQPVEPTRDCPDCLMCGNPIGAQPNGCFGVALPVVWTTVEVDRPTSQAVFVTRRIALAAPRGPPAVTASFFKTPEPAGMTQALDEHELRADRRPLPEDAAT
jgi:hypothetical protein